jgi:hypothetical protein
MIGLGAPERRGLVIAVANADEYALEAKQAQILARQPDFTERPGRDPSMLSGIGDGARHQGAGTDGPMPGTVQRSIRGPIRIVCGRLGCCEDIPENGLVREPMRRLESGGRMLQAGKNNVVDQERRIPVPTLAEGQPAQQSQFVAARISCMGRPDFITLALDGLHEIAQSKAGGLRKRAIGVDSGMNGPHRLDNLALCATSPGKQKIC